jgi:uncharacterized protein YndB with AHSA1/START domain
MTATAEKKSSARAIADVTNGMLLATVEIAATPERIFRALTTDEVTKWWGSPDAYGTKKWTADLRVGGKWHSEGLMADGKPFTINGEYLELDPPRKLTFTWRPSWDGDNQTRVSYRLEPTATGTRVTLRHEGFADRAQVCEGHTQGWERVLGFLESYFNTNR